MIELKIGESVVVSEEDAEDFFDEGILHEEDAAPKMPRYTHKIVGPKLRSPEVNAAMTNNSCFYSN